jgi:myo-inositol-1-phosphate synthase
VPEIELTAGPSDYEDAEGDGPVSVLLQRLLMTGPLRNACIRKAASARASLSATVALAEQRHSACARIRAMTSVNVGLVGVGNCASSLVQGLAFYGVEDVRIVSAFDVAPEKVGRDVGEAIWVAPNNALGFAEVGTLGVTVRDGGPEAAVDVVGALRASGTEVVVSLLPTGAQRESEAYAEAALSAGCGFVNCMPAVLARDPAWAARFADARLPLIGDDLKSRFGTTLIHRAILDALSANGVEIVSTFQLNAAGNEDFRALEDPAALATKQETKTVGMAPGGAGVPSHLGTSHIPHLADRKTAFIRVDALGFGANPIEIDVRRSLEDSPSAAPVTRPAPRRRRSSKAAAASFRPSPRAS